MARPTKVTKVRSLFDLAGYHRRFVKDFSRIVFLLTNLLMRTTMFEWSDKCEETFQELKRRLTTAPILTLPVEGQEYTIYNGTSILRMG